jgi:predicted AAA+ superfamily ATPase
VQYYNLKDPDIRRALKTSARREFEHFRDSLIVLDEVQQMPALLELIQIQVDTRPQVKGQFLLLGSNHLLLHRQIKESLAGRVALYTLAPLSFGERLGRDGDRMLGRLMDASTIEQLEALLGETYLPLNESSRLNSLFQEFNLYGGYPEFLTRTDPHDRQHWLRDYHQTYLETDLREIVDLRTPESFERFEQLFAPRAGSLLNVSELARDCALSADTIRRFMRYYQQLFVAWPCRPFYKNIAKRMMKMPKWYFTDTGLLRSLLGDFRPENGTLFENTVLSEIRKIVYLKTLGDNVYFARTAAGIEVDALFTGSEQRTVLLCEVKQSQGATRAHIRHLKKFISDSPERIGLLVNMSHSIEKLEHRIWQVPAPQLLS